MTSQSRHQSNWYLRFGKRLFDVCLAAMLVTILSPLLAALAILVRWKMGTPILFCQARPGLNGQIFQIFKFRTMTDERDASGELLPNEFRLNAFGRWLRSTSLDELPELLNIVRGEMSFVGPRPLLPEYLARYSTEQARRHEVRPGLTGWAQVNGRNATSWDQRFQNDVWYVDHVSLWLDIAILFRTARTVLLREGINSAEAVTMPPFLGNAAETGETHKRAS